MNWQPGKCKPGDVIRVNLGILHHYGIFVSEEEVIAFGLPPIPENRVGQTEVAVLSTDIDTFACGKIVEVASFDKKEKAKKFSDLEIIARAKSRIGETGYNLIHNNCEHFVNECALGVKYCSVEDAARKRWNSRPLLDIYLSRVDKGTELSPVYPKERDEEIAACKNEDLKLCKFADWRLLGKALKSSLHTDINSLEFTKTKHGKWLSDKAFFSLSHSGGFVAVAVSNVPVGIDIEIKDNFYKRWEKSEDKLPSLAKKVYTRAELKVCPIEKSDFLKIWCLKEAIFKKDGKGSFNPKKIDSLETHSAVFGLGETMPLTAVSCEHLSRARFFMFENGKLSLIKGSKL